MEQRKTGWLIPSFYYKFREILTHTTFRFGFCCPIYCCMPDHIHMLWIGIYENCDQRTAMRYFRKQLNPILELLGARFQLQPYDTCSGKKIASIRPSKRLPNTLPGILNAESLCRRMDLQDTVTLAV